jgi:formate hydrogenlyase subunit 3/multisubunit Na+/H+ antiporter MnhD subunit
LNISPFSDIILLLSIITIFLSSAYLSERDTRFNWGGLSFFNIFIAITIQLVSVEDLLSMFIYFELLFFPSLFFIFKYGYVQKAEGGMLFLFGWTLCGATICLVGFVYLYFIVHSLQFSVIRSFQFSDSERLFFGFIFCVGFGVKMPL